MTAEHQVQSEIRSLPDDVLEDVVAIFKALGDGTRAQLVFVLTKCELSVSELADMVGIIDRGKLIIEGPPDELIAEMGADVIHLRGDGEQGTFISSLDNEPFVKIVNTSDNLIQIGVDSASKRIVDILKKALDAQYHVTNVS